MENKLRRGLALLMTLIMLISCAPMDALAAIVPVSGGTQTSPGITLLSIVQKPVATTTYVFMNGTEEFARQILKNGETLNNPGTPDAGSPNKEFVGWFDESGNQLTFPITASVGTVSSTVTVNARFADVYFVFFTNPSGEVMVTKKGANGDTITAAGVTYPVGNEQSIIGWNYTGNENDPLISEVKLEGEDVTLKAVVKDGHWITYDSQGGTYVAPAFVKGNGTTTAPADPTRPGYTFHHWSATVGGAVFTFGNALTTALTLYAVWTPNTRTQYTVIHWQENADDDEYSYAESETKTGTTGAQTSAAAKSYTGFTAQTIAQQTIAGDGSTIVNVYYKRNEYNVQFYERKNGRWQEITSLRITAKYGAFIGDKWPTYDGSSTWSTNSSYSWSEGLQGPYQVNIETMPLNGAKFYGPNTDDGSESAYYYVEVLPGESGETVSGVTYKLHHKDTSPGTGYTVTVEDQYPITGFTFNSYPSTETGDRYNNAKFYYTRNSYNIVYVSGGQTVNTASKKFEQSIADAGSYTPTVKPAGMEDYDFGGWHADPAGEQAYTFTGKTMPAQNVTVYAKWNKPVYNGTIHLTIEGTGSSITLNVPKGDTIETALNEKQAEIMAHVGEGYTWRGWRTGKDGTGEPFNPKTQITTDVTLYPYYTKDGTFKVEYDAVKNDVTAPVDGKSYAEDSFADLMSPGKLVADDGEYFLGWSDGAATYQPRDKYQIKSNHANEQNVITLTAQWGARPGKVSLTYNANGGVGADVVENLANNATVTTRPANTFSRVGYTFKGWDTDPKGTGSIAPNTQVQVDNNGANVLYAIWTANTDTKYTVEFYYQNTDGSYPQKANESVVRNDGTTDTTVSVKDSDKLPQDGGKYVFDESNANNVLSGVVAGNGSLVLKLYFKLNTASYTIHHYLNGTTVKVADDQTGAMTIGEELTANKSNALYLAYAAADVASYAPSQTITIAADESENVITVYYTMPLTIKAKDASKTYDGDPLTQPDFTMEGLVNGDTKENFSLSMTAASTITNAGSTPNVIDTATVKYNNGGEIPSYYNVSYKPGTLTVNKASATVTITGVNKTHVYDGTQHEANGYNYSFTGKPNEITISPKSNVVAIARRTDVGTTYMGLTKDSFTVTSANYDVTIKAVIDGYVTITPVTDKVTVTVTENGDIVTYDGNEHSVKGYKSMTADNKLYDVTKSVKATETAAWTAKGTNAGEYPVGIAAGDFENTNKNFTNVTFKIVDGVLKINPITENTITITAASASKTYDGTPLTNNGFTFTEGVLVKGDELTAVVEGSQTDVGSSDNVVTSYKVMRGNKDVTGNYTFGESVKGTLTVNKRPVTIIAQDNKKEYDGQSHGKNPDTAYVVKAAAENSGLVSGHTESNVNIAFTAVDAGTYAGMLAIDKAAVTIVDSNNNDVTGNYAIEVEPGTLTIEQYKGEVTVTITGNTQLFTYDCTKHTVQGFTATVNNSLYNVNTDFKYDGNLYEAATLLAVAEGTNVGVYHMNLLSNHCVNLNKNFANVTFRVQDGSLAIERQYLAIEVDNSSKVYGAADPAFADATLRFYNKTGEIIKPSAEMMQDVSTIDLTVHRADAGDNTIGTHVNVLTISKTAEELNKIYTNYEIGVDKGNFEITSTEESLKVRADNYEGAYDGDGHGVVAKAYVNGTDEEPKAVIRYYNEGTGKFDLTESPKFIDVKSDTPGERTYKVRFQATLDGMTAEGSANVLIAPRKLILSSGTESQDYDGLPLTSQEVVIEEGSIIKGQIYDLKATGSVTTVADGMVENTITYSTTDEFKSVNYEIEQEPGMLHIEKRDVILTSETASKEYDGTPLTRENVTVERNAFVDGEVTDLRATGSVTYVDQGEVRNTITFTPTDKFDKNNYSITKQEGKLSITKREGEGKTITVTAANDEKVYDGTPLTNNGFTHTGVLVDGDVLTAIVEGSATNVGDEGKNVVKSYAVKRGETDVTKNYTFGNSIDGKLTINPRKVTLTSETASKEYDGKPLTKPVVTVTGDGFVTGEGATYTFTGSQTVVGSSANAFTYTLNEGTNAGNYEVAKTEGTLTVTQNEKAITITANSHTWEYDGQAHSDGGYTVEYDGQTYKVEAGKTVTLPTGDIVKAKITKTVTNVSDSAPNNNTIDELTIVNAAGEDTKGQYKTIPLIPGTLTITKRGAGEEKVKITAADNTVEYDGQPHGAKLNAANQIEVGTSFTVTNLADGHSVKTLAIDGSETDAGVYANKLVPGNAVIVDGNGVEVTANYDITYVPGTLTITQRGSGDMKVVLTAANNTVVYDGQPHGAKLNAAGEIELGTSYTTARLVEGHYVDKNTLDITGSQMNVGVYEEELKPAVKAGATRIVIRDKDGNDVTDNYALTLVNATLTITGDKLIPDKKAEDENIESNYKLGDEIEFTITVKNVSIYDVENVIVTDANAEIKAGNGYTVSADKHTATIAIIAAKSEIRIKALHTVTSEDILAGKVGNVANVTWKDGETTVTKTVDDDTTKLTPPDVKLTVTKTSDWEGKATGAKPKLGTKITYTITVKNDGNVPYTNVNFTDLLQNGDASVTGEIPTYGTLPVNEEKSFTVEYIVTEADLLKESINNKVTAEADEIEYTYYEGKTEKTGKATPKGEAEVTDRTDDAKASTISTKTTTSKPKNEKGYELGETITYDIVVTNDGNLTVTDIEVKEELAGAVIKESTDGAYTVDGSIAKIAELKPGQSVTVKVEYVVTEADILAGSVKNEATVTGKGPDDKNPDPDKPGTEDPTDTPKAELNIEKSVLNAYTDNTPFKLGEKIEYQLTITTPETNNVTVKDVKVTDTLLTKANEGKFEITSLPEGAAAAYDNDGKLIITMPNIDPGKHELVIKYTYTVQETDLGTVKDGKATLGTVHNAATVAGTTDDPKVIPGSEDGNDVSTVAKLTITANDNSHVYDGKSHGARLNDNGQIKQNVSYTLDAELLDGHEIESVDIPFTAILVGVYDSEETGWLMPENAKIITAGGEDVTSKYYKITYVPGTLTITASTKELKIVANSTTWTYNGEQHTDGGYTVTYGNESYTVKAGESATLSTGDKVTAVVKGQVKDVDDTKAGNNEIVEWSVEHRDFYNNVTPANGTLTITPRKVTLKSDGGSKKYDGTPLTKPEVTVTGDGFVVGEVTGITATGSVTYVSQGEVDNLITFTKNEGFKDSNYEIKEIIGKLSIEALDVTIIITGPSAIREYKPGVTHTIVTGGSELDFVYGSDKVDGKIGVEGMVEGDKILPGTLKHTLEGMYVGEYEGVFTLFDSNGKKADKPTVMHDGVDVTENYKFSYNPGKLTITGKHMDGGKEVENEVPEKNYLLGQKIPFTITVRSVSKDELKDVTVTDPTATILPDRNTANPAYTVSEDEHTATITSLAPEAEVIVYAEHEVTEDDIINRYTNEATINWGNDEVKVSKTPSIEEENPEAELVKEIVLQDGQDENHKFKLGETVYFKITVTNTGNVTLNEYEVKEVLPGAAFIDGTGYTLNNDKTVATIEKMEPVKDGQEAPDSNQIVLYAQYNIKEEDLGNKELKNIVTADNSKPGEVPIPVDEAKSVSGQKIWKDEGNAFNTRPASITLTLMRKLGQNGAAEQYRTMQLGSNGSWRYSFDHLPKHDAQENEYFYWVVEEPVTGYDTAYETKDESHCDIVNNLQTYTLTIHYWQHKLGDTKMEQAFPDYVATLYYKQPYDVESPEREGIILDDMSQARISGTMPAHDLVIDVYYHRIAYRLTIHYIYQDGTMAHEDYTWTYWFNSTYNVPSPIIPGFTPSIDVIAGRMPSHGLELTVVYVGDSEIVIPDEDTSLGFKSYLNAGECFE